MACNDVGLQAQTRDKFELKLLLIFYKFMYYNMNNSHCKRKLYFDLENKIIRTETKRLGITNYFIYQDVQYACWVQNSLSNICQ